MGFWVVLLVFDAYRFMLAFVDCVIYLGLGFGIGLRFAWFLYFVCFD